MSDIPPINEVARVTSYGPARVRETTNNPRVETPTDRVEISEMAQLLSALEPETDIRTDKVLDIREAIAQGTYETPDKIDYTVNRLIEILTRET